MTKKKDNPGILGKVTIQLGNREVTRALTTEKFDIAEGLRAILDQPYWDEDEDNADGKGESRRQERK